MKLSEWAKKNGLSYRTAYRLFASGKLPCRVRQLETGTILVDEEDEKPSRLVLYGRVSSHDQKEDLERQLNRLRDWCASKGFIVFKEVTDIGSGLNGHRKNLLSVLSDKTVTHVAVEHKDRLARFGWEMVEACLNASGRTLLVMNETECKDDLVQDFIDVVTSMCARIYGRRSAKNRAKKAFEATK